MIRKIFAFPLMLLALSACVTINIYFPAAAAEEAARTIVRDVLKNGQPQEQAPPNEQEKQSRSTAESPLLIAFGRAIEFVVAPVHAAQADININTATIRAIRSSMQRRQSSLSPFYASGAIGFDNKGSVAIRDLNAASLADRNRLRKLVSDENADRSKLYREIAAENGHPEWESDVRATFAKVWAQEAPSKYWYQTTGGAWKQR